MGGDAGAEGAGGGEDADLGGGGGHDVVMKLPVDVKKVCILGKRGTCIHDVITSKAMSSAYGASVQNARRRFVPARTYPLLVSIAGWNRVGCCTLKGWSPCAALATSLPFNSLFGHDHSGNQNLPCEDPGRPTHQSLSLSYHLCVPHLAVHDHYFSAENTCKVSILNFDLRTL